MVELRDVGRKLLFADIDDRIIGARRQRVVVGLRGHAAADRLGIGAVAADGPFEPQGGGCQHRHHPIEALLQPRLVQDGAFEEDVGRLLPIGPPFEIGRHGRVHQCLQCCPLGGIAEDAGRQIGTVRGAVLQITFGTEAGANRLAQRRIFGHQAPCGGIAVVDRHAPLGEEAADGAFAAADPPRNADAQFHRSSGFSIVGSTPLIEMILMSEQRTDIACCSEAGSITRRP